MYVICGHAPSNAGTVLSVVSEDGVWYLRGRISYASSARLLCKTSEAETVHWEMNDVVKGSTAKDVVKYFHDNGLLRRVPIDWGTAPDFGMLAGYLWQALVRYLGED